MTGRTLEESYEGFTALVASAIIEWHSRLHRRAA